MFESLVDIRFAGNELWRLAAFFVVVLLALAAGRLARLFLEKTASQYASGSRGWIGVLLRSLARSCVLVGATLGLWLGVAALRLTPGVESLAETLLHVLAAAAVGFALFCTVDVVDYRLRHAAQRTKSRLDDMLVPLVGKSIRITILVMVGLQIMQALSEKPITSILAGLGVGGLAIALAGQDSIRNFFGSIVILGDKPFEIGDRVVFDGHDGPVESVGFRSTKIRTLEGHLVTVPNSELVTRTVQNIGKRPHIRRLGNITIAYGTRPEKVREAVSILRSILDGHEGMHPDYPPRVYFSEFNEWSLNILFLYWYHPPDFWAYMEFTERVNMEILQRFNAAGIEFAFPTQTVHLAGSALRLS